MNNRCDHSVVVMIVSWRVIWKTRTTWTRTMRTRTRKKYDKKQSKRKMRKKSYHPFYKVTILCEIIVRVRVRVTVGLSMLSVSVLSVFSRYVVRVRVVRVFQICCPCPCCPCFPDMLSVSVLSVFSRYVVRVRVVRVFQICCPCPCCPCCLDNRREGRDQNRDRPDAIWQRDANLLFSTSFNPFLFFSNLRKGFNNLSYLVHISKQITFRWWFYLLLKIEKSRRQIASRLCGPYKQMFLVFSGT